MGERGRQRCPSVLQRRFVLNDTSFELRSLCIAWIGENLGSPSIGRMVGFFEAIDKIIEGGGRHGGGGEELINKLQS